jgi:hypothetical protein
MNERDLEEGGERIKKGMGNTKVIFGNFWN